VAQGIKIDQGRLTEVEKGTTTYSQVVALYGKPNYTLIRDDGSRQAIYHYVQSQPNPLSYIPAVGAFIQSGSREETSTVFEFNEHGVLISYSSTQGEVVTGTGFLSGSRQK
jgi:hypothetical protein